MRLCCRDALHKFQKRLLSVQQMVCRRPLSQLFVHQPFNFFITFQKGCWVGLSRVLIMPKTFITMTTDVAASMLLIVASIAMRMKNGQQSLYHSRLWPNLQMEESSSAIAARFLLISRPPSKELLLFVVDWDAFLHSLSLWLVHN